MGPELILLAQLGAGSPEGARISARQLVDAPKSYVEKTIVLPSLACVSDPKAGFVCVAVVAGRGLRIEASLLGAKTAQRIAERLIGECKGTANLHSKSCRFDVEIQPRSMAQDTLDTPSGSLPLVQVYSGQIEMYRPRR